MFFTRIRHKVTFCKVKKKRLFRITEVANRKHEYNFNKKMELWISTKYEKGACFVMGIVYKSITTKYIKFP